MKRILILLLSVAVLCLLTGCRVRTTGAGYVQTSDGSVQAAAGGENGTERGQDGDGQDDSTAAYEIVEDADSLTLENSDAQRREYDEQANAILTAGASHRVEGEGLGEGQPHADAESPLSADPLREEESRTATQNIPAAQADRKGTDENAPDADSSLTYYTVLLAERSGSLFECERKNLYWETAQPFRTVYKQSLEHQWILQSGCYDVSARLLEENLTVDAGWVQRKNPNVVVKIVEKGVLGYGVSGTALAEAMYQSLVSRAGWEGMDAVQHGRVLLASEQLLTSQHLRTALLVAIAKLATPELYEDVNIEEALQSLAQEATGAPAEGTFLYWKAP